MISLARKMLVYEWRRFLPAVLGVGFSGLLLTVQAALVLGIFGSAAIYVTQSNADLWIGYPGTQSVDQGRPIDRDVEMHLRMNPEVSDVEPYLWIDGSWRSPRNVGGISVFLSGIDPRTEGMMFARLVTPILRQRLAEPGAVIVDRADLKKLNVSSGEFAFINGRQVRVAGAITGLRALGGVNVITSLETARSMDATAADTGRVTYFVARVRDRAHADAVRTRLGAGPSFGPYEVWTAGNFAFRAQMYWMLETGAGVAVLFLTGLVLLVGMVVASQALTSIVVGSAKEYATLNALGVGMPGLRRVVLEQAAWVGGLGLITSAAFSVLLLSLAYSEDVPVAITPMTMLICAALIMCIAIVSGLIAVRGLLRAEPATLLR